MTRHTWTADEEAVLIRTNPTHTTAQQAATLGLTITQVRGHRRVMRRRGLLPSVERAYGRAWSADERAELESLLMQGKPIKTIAKRLRRGVSAIYSQMSRKGVGVQEMRAAMGMGVRSASAVARLMGVSDVTVALWIGRKWLRAQRDNTWRSKNKAKARKVGRPRYLVTDEALMDFIEERAAWLSWSGSTITDPDWRDYAAGVRARAGGEWVSTVQLAARYHYTDSTVLGWYARGLMPGIRTLLWRQTRYFWSTDLAGFIPPMERRFAA